MSAQETVAVVLDLLDEAPRYALIGEHGSVDIRSFSFPEWPEIWKSIRSCPSEQDFQKSAAANLLIRLLSNPPWKKAETPFLFIAMPATAHSTHRQWLHKLKLKTGRFQIVSRELAFFRKGYSIAATRHGIVGLTGIQTDELAWLKYVNPLSAAPEADDGELETIDWKALEPPSNSTIEDLEGSLGLSVDASGSTVPWSIEDSAIAQKLAAELGPKETSKTRVDVLAGLAEMLIRQSGVDDGRAALFSANHDYAVSVDDGPKSIFATRGAPLPTTNLRGFVPEVGGKIAHNLVLWQKYNGEWQEIASFDLKTRASNPIVFELHLSSSEVANVFAFDMLHFGHVELTPSLFTMMRAASH